MMKKILALILLAAAIFVGTYFGVLWLKDPEVDLAKYDNVVPAYKVKIKELRIASKLASGYFLGLRTQEGLNRLEALTELNSPISKAAKQVLFFYYSQPERYKCEFIENCPEMHQRISFERSENAFNWARKMPKDAEVLALASLLRNTRVAPIATEADRIKLMAATEDVSNESFQAATALAFHYLDNRYFKSDMIAEANLWLERAAEVEQNL